MAFNTALVPQTKQMLLDTLDKFDGLIGSATIHVEHDIPNEKIKVAGQILNVRHWSGNVGSLDYAQHFNLPLNGAEPADWMYMGLFGTTIGDLEGTLYWITKMIKGAGDNNQVTG